jgi:hypothetical protein
MYMSIRTNCYFPYPKKNAAQASVKLSLVVPACVGVTVGQSAKNELAYFMWNLFMHTTLLKKKRIYEEIQKGSGAKSNTVC